MGIIYFSTCFGIYDILSARYLCRFYYAYNCLDMIVYIKFILHEVLCHYTLAYYTLYVYYIVLCRVFAVFTRVLPVFVQFKFLLHKHKIV